MHGILCQNLRLFGLFDTFLLEFDRIFLVILVWLRLFFNDELWGFRFNQFFPTILSTVCKFSNVNYRGFTSNFFYGRFRLGHFYRNNFLFQIVLDDDIFDYTIIFLKFFLNRTIILIRIVSIFRTLFCNQSCFCCHTFHIFDWFLRFLRWRWYYRCFSGSLQTVKRFGHWLLFLLWLW